MNQMPSMNSSPAVGNKIPKGYSRASVGQFTPEQMGLFQQLFSNVSPESFLGKLAGGDQSQFQQLEAPALRQFNDLQSGIANRFSSAGSMGSRNSSGFQQAQNSASSNFAQNLQSQRIGLQQQALEQLMGLSSSLLQQRPYENSLVEKQQFPSFLEQLLTGVLGGASQIGGQAASLALMGII